MQLSLRVVFREWKECPATIILCSIWVLVFAAMAVAQLAEPEAITWKQWVYLGLTDGHRFGDCTLPDLGHGQVWRLVTSTFVHYNLLHISLNLLIMYQLGAVIESWYGSAQLLLLYLLTGGGGNAASAVIRELLKADPRIHWGGGSVVIMGLVALCCVVGWRARTPMGLKLGRQTLFVLAATALLGWLLPNYVDNWGHTGGAIVGVALGFADPWLLKRISSPSAWGNGVVSCALMVFCGAAQFESDRRETPVREQRNLARLAIDLDRAAVRLAAARQSLVRTGRANGPSELLAKWTPPLLPSARDELAQLQERLAAATGSQLQVVETTELAASLDRLIRAVREQLVANQRRLRLLRTPAANRESPAA